MPTTITITDAKYAGVDLVEIISCEVDPPHRSLMSDPKTRMTLKLATKRLAYGEGYSIEFSGWPTEGVTQSYIHDKSAVENVLGMSMVFERRPDMTGREEGDGSARGPLPWPEMMEDSKDFEHCQWQAAHPPISGSIPSKTLGGGGQSAPSGVWSKSPFVVLDEPAASVTVIVGIFEPERVSDEDDQNEEGPVEDEGGDAWEDGTFGSRSKRKVNATGTTGKGTMTGDGSTKLKPQRLVTSTVPPGPRVEATDERVTEDQKEWMEHRRPYRAKFQEIQATQGLKR